MEVAVLADIHGNYEAFEACVEYALGQGINTFFLLGDYLGEHAYPQRTMECIYEIKEKYACYMVKGNKEDYWLGYKRSGEKGWEFGNSTTGTMLYQYERLTDKDFAFFEALPIAQKVTIEALPPLTLCHGSPISARQTMHAEDAETLKVMESCETDIILYGHTHRRRTIEHQGKVAYNPGSVGSPLESGGRAQFMILHGENGQWSPEYIDLEYDVESVIHNLYEAGLDKYAPSWCKITELLLRTGEIAHGRVLTRVMDLCREETGKCDWPDIPEKYWEQVIRQVQEEMAVL